MSLIDRFNKFESKINDEDFINEVNNNLKRFASTVVINPKFTIFHKKGKVDKDKFMNKRLCYSNSLEIAKTTDLKLCVGYLIRKTPNSSGLYETVSHGWNYSEKEGKVYDYTLSTTHTSKDYYVGRIISDSELKSLKDGSDVRDLI